MPHVDLADDCYVAAAPVLVAGRLRRPAFWRTCWPDLTLRSYHDRGREGMRWYVDGTLVGTAEVWLEPFRDGTLVHTYLRADPSGQVRKPARLTHRYATGLKRALFALKDDLERAAIPEVLELRDSTRPVRTYVWRPDAVEPPLVLLSHGTGGHAQELDWLANALLATGFAVAAVEHHGCNLMDGNVTEGSAWERPGDLSFVLDSLEDYDKRRIGVAGYSGGAYAAAGLLGADPRVGAAYLLAPAMGPMLDAESLAKLDRPVAVRWGDADDIAPPERNALRYAALIPDADCRSLGPDVGHHVFDGDQPDPTGVRTQVATDAVAFFTEWLRETGAPSRERSG